MDPRAILLLEGLSKLKNKFNDLIGIRTRDLPVCSILPQPTTLPRACGGLRAGLDAVESRKIPSPTRIRTPVPCLITILLMVEIIIKQ
jgi:hypothetical protein